MAGIQTQVSLTPKTWFSVLCEVGAGSQVPEATWGECETTENQPVCSAVSFQSLESALKDLKIK